MARKSAEFISYGNDSQCEETQKFIEDAGIRIDLRDIEKQPLTEYEIAGLIGYLDISHFLNPMSKSYTKHGLDKNMPERHELIKMIVEDHTLLRRPIIRTSRLLTIGCNKKAISDLLQLNSNGNRPSEPNHSHRGHGKHKASASSGR